MIYPKGTRVTINRVNQDWDGRIGTLLERVDTLRTFDSVEVLLDELGPDGQESQEVSLSYLDFNVVREMEQAE